MTKIENHHSFAFKKCKQVTVVVTVISIWKIPGGIGRVSEYGGLRDSSWVRETVGISFCAPVNPCWDCRISGTSVTGRGSLAGTAPATCNHSNIFNSKGKPYNCDTHSGPIIEYIESLGQLPSLSLSFLTFWVDSFLECFKTPSS